MLTLVNSLVCDTEGTPEALPSVLNCLITRGAKPVETKSAFSAWSIPTASTGWLSATAVS